MKIISGGQTGVDRAALDAAMALHMEYGGSIPRGRKAEDGPISTKYAYLHELETDRYEVRTERNVMDATATLIFTVGTPTDGTAATIGFTRKHGRPCVIIDLKEKSDDEAIMLVKDWLSEIRPDILNVAGPRESKEPGIHARTYTILKQALSRR